MPPSFLTITWLSFHEEGNPSSNLLYASASVSWSILLRDNALNLLDVTHDQTFVNPSTGINVGVCSKEMGICFTMKPAACK